MNELLESSFFRAAYGSVVFALTESAEVNFCSYLDYDFDPSSYARLTPLTLMNSRLVSS